MTKWRLLITMVFSAFAFSAHAHRLNEYLQATTLSLTRDAVTMHLHLTAGSGVSKKVLKDIDLNGNGILSDAEQQAYARHIVRNLLLTIDDQESPLTLVTWNFPTVADIANGVGDIQLILKASLPSKTPGHRLVLSHHNLQPSVVYLVNCLMPTDLGIRITDQNRNADQSVYQLDFITGETKEVASANQESLNKADHWAITKTYFLDGVRHILTGYDHILFLCALILGTSSLWGLIKIVTAFTIAHSITLTLATYGLAHLPEQIVEPMIAASIVFVAIQNIFWPKQSGGYTRLMVAFFFGLFHGLGFASGLLELMHAMPASMVVFAIIGFSIGVEAGNQLVLLPLYSFLQLIRQPHTQLAKSRLLLIQQYASGAVAVAGTYYLVTELYACF